MMRDSLSMVWIITGVLILAAIILWIAVPLLTGLPWVPSHAKRIRRALEMAEIAPGEVVYDLGAGDGRVLIIAAREFGARAVGIEISPMHCLIAWLKSGLSGFGSQVTIRCASIYTADVSGADVVFAYVTPEHAARLRPILEKQLKSGARVVTISAEMEGWQPDQIDKNDLVFLYRMPPAPGSIVSYLSKDLIP